MLGQQAGGRLVKRSAARAFHAGDGNQGLESGQASQEVLIGAGRTGPGSLPAWIPHAAVGVEWQFLK